MIIQVQDHPIRYIRTHGCLIDLERNNQKPAACQDCHTRLQTGEGVYRNAFMGKGFVCFHCLRADTLVRTRDFGFPQRDAGFHFTRDFDTLAQCYEGHRQFTTTEILDIIRAEWKYEIAERTLGPDISPGRIYDASESIQL